MELLIEPVAAIMAEILAPLLGALLALLTEAALAVYELLRGLLRLIAGRSPAVGVRPPPAADPPLDLPPEAGRTPPAPRDAPPHEPPPIEDAPPPAPGADDAAGTPPKPFRWRRLLIIGVALLGTLWAADRLLLGVVAQHAAARVAEERGFTVEWQAIEGHLLTGAVTLEGLRIQRPQHPRTVVDMNIERLEVDVAVLSLLGDEPIVIESAALRGLQRADIETDQGSRRPICRVQGARRRRCREQRQVEQRSNRQSGPASTVSFDVRPLQAARSSAPAPASRGRRAGASSSAT